MARALRADARGGFPLFAVGGIRVRIDPSWFLIFLLVWWSLAAGYLPRSHPDAGRADLWVAGLVSTLLFFASLLLHELSHSFVARRAGIEVPSITLFLFGGASEMVREPDDPATELRIAIAGPLTSFGLAGAFALLARVLDGAASGLWLGVVEYLAWINLALGVFNLLPGLPLDGGRILRALVWSRTGSLERASRAAARAGEWLGLGLAVLGGLQIAGGNLVGGVWLVLIGLFARGLAGSSHRAMLLRQALAGSTVADAMARDPVSVPADLPLERFVEDYVLRFGHRSFPVLDGDRLLGMISIDRVKEVPLERRAREPVRDHLDAGAAEVFVAPETPLLDALSQLEGSGRQRLLVSRTRSGPLEGLLTRSGVARFVELQGGLAEPAGAA